MNGKRQVWVGCVKDDKEAKPLELYTGQWTHVKKIEIHVSRWIPVSERMPDKPGHYHVVRLDREDWCYCDELLTLGTVTMKFTSKGVTHWLEAPPLPVESQDDNFEEWYKNEWPYSKHMCTTKEELRKAWNAAKDSNGPRP